MNMRNLFLPATALSLALAACSQPAETDKTATASYDGEVASEDKAADTRPPAIKPTDVATPGRGCASITSAETTEPAGSGANRNDALACSIAAQQGPAPRHTRPGLDASEGTRPGTETCWRPQQG